MLFWNTFLYVIFPRVSQARTLYIGLFIIFDMDFYFCLVNAACLYGVVFLEHDDIDRAEQCLLKVSHSSIVVCLGNHSVDCHPRNQTPECVNTWEKMLKIKTIEKHDPRRRCRAGRH